MKTTIAYYAHSKKIYNTIREENELKYLRTKRRWEVIGPKSTLGELGCIEPYLKAVRPSD